MDSFTSISAKAAALAALVFALGPPTSAAQDLQRHGEVTGADGQEVTVQLSEGLSVSSGTAGTIYTTTTVGGEERSVRVAKVEVTEADGRTVTAEITSQTETPETGFAVSFETVRRQGTLIVRSDPEDAVVFLDGKRLGQAVQKVTLDSGDHRLRVTAEGYEAEQQTLQVRAGETVDRTFDLNQLTGRLKITSSPSGAEIKVRGGEYKSYKQIGSTPLQGVELPPGNYDLRIRKDGYQTATDVVSLEPEELAEKSYQLEPATGTLIVDSSPRSVSVYIEGETQLKGETKLKKEVPPGRYRVRLEEDGNKLVTKSRRVEAGEQTRVYHELSQQSISEGRSSGTDDSSNGEGQETTGDLEEEGGYRNYTYYKGSVDLTFPLSPFGDSYKTGVGGRIEYVYPISSSVDAGLMGGIIHNRFDDSSISEDISVEGRNSNIYLLIPNIKIRPSSESYGGQYIPYASVGAGLFSINVSEGKFRDQKLPSYSESVLGFSAELGLRSREGGFTEVRYVRGQTEGEPTGIITLGIGWTL